MKRLVGLGLLPPLPLVAVAVGRGRVAPGADVLVAGWVEVISSKAENITTSS